LSRQHNSSRTAKGKASPAELTLWYGVLSLSTAAPLDLHGSEIHEHFDVTDERLRGLYEAFDRDFDGRLNKQELLQGLAQQVGQTDHTHPHTPPTTITTDHRAACPTCGYSCCCRWGLSYPNKHQRARR
jgi:hypothetical protein